MNEDPSDKTPRGPLRALAGLFRRAGTSPPPHPSAPLPQQEGTPPSISHYAITGQLGRGGMGIVYAARDPRLERTVAIKTMTALAGDESARQRFWREARAAASVNHPNICQIYEIGEHDGELFIAMELLEGESLADRMRDGPLTVAETIPIGLGMLAALSALHARGIIHRDLKPSNVFLTKHGVKLLDFGLARPIPSGLDTSIAVELTQAGMLVGTPRYIAPEQVTGETIDGRCDLFAAGAILFEMLAGRPAFNGNNMIEILHATIHEQPPALSGSPAVAAVDRVIRRALAKRPAERPASAEAMAAELRAVRIADGEGAGNGHGGGTPALARTLTRIVVLPFRVLRPDPETDFLAFSLPDAIATSLTGFGSLIVRSTTTVARFAGETPDLKALAADADVDRVVTGTLLRAGDQLRATAQLVEAPGGTLLASLAVTSSMGDLFRLQDDLARRVVESLSLPLAGPAPTPDAPHDARAYALYLEANALAREYGQLPEALDRYQRCVELDPGFAPAWAQLGRTYRVIGKFMGGPDDSDERAEGALRRALELNPRLPIAHKHYAHLESDTGHSRAALVRLLDAAGRHGNDPELFAGLVHACRYCGLLDQSVAAHEEARRLDPNIVTSLEQTLLMKWELEPLLTAQPAGNLGAGAHVIHITALGAMGRADEARGLLRFYGRGTEVHAFHAWSEFMLAWLDRRTADMRRIRAEMKPFRIMEDPEAMFQEAFFFSGVGETDHALEMLRRAIRKGYFAAEAMSKTPAFDALRGDPRFQDVLAEAERGRDEALAAFRERGGERLLGRRG